MYRNILIASDGSETAQKCVDHGLELARALGARIVVVTITEPFPYYAAAGGVAGVGWVPSQQDLDSYAEGQENLAAGLLSTVADAARAKGIEVETMHVADARPAEAIGEAAKAKRCDLIVMGSHGRRGLQRLLLGSQASEVLSTTEVPVLVVR